MRNRPCLSSVPVPGGRRFLALALAVFVAAWAVPPAVRAQVQDGLVQRSDKAESDLLQLEEDNRRLADQLKALRREFETYRDGRVGRVAQSVCGALNADWGVDTKSWDYGRPLAMTSRSSCDALCSKKEGYGKCDGLVMINGSGMVTGRSCDFAPPQRYLDSGAHVFCCCR